MRTENSPLEDVQEAIANLAALGVNVERIGTAGEVYSLEIALVYLNDAELKLERAS